MKYFYDELNDNVYVGVQINNDIEITENEFNTIKERLDDFQRINDQKNFLNKTDFIAAKLAEYNAGIIVEDIKTKYIDIFNDRIEARKEINSLEEKHGI